MRNSTWLVGSVGLAILAGGLISRAHAAGGPEDPVIAAEQQWLKAEQTNNIQLMKPLLAEKIILTTEDGRVLKGKDAVLADAKATTWSAADYADLNVTVFERTAIATGTFTGKGKDESGKTFETRVRFTDTWLKMSDGTWMCVAGHDSPTKS